MTYLLSVRIETHRELRLLSVKCQHVMSNVELLSWKVVDYQQAAGSVHNILRILNSRLGPEGNIKDLKDVAYITV